MYEEAFKCGASNKEIYIMSKIGAQQVFRSGNTRWVFGYSFIKDFHVIFDKKEMKLYMKRNNINKK